jgi:fructokinase
MGAIVSMGVDLGGTKIEAAVVRRESSGGGLVPDRFEVLVRERVKTERDRGYNAVLATTADLVQRTAASAGVDLGAMAVGVGMPGSITRREGLVKNSNTVCLNGRPFRADLAKKLGRPVRFENDANCFALAEARLGAARAYADGVVFGVILGTGVGGGLVFRGSIWGGAQSIAGEWGHHAVGPWRRPGESRGPMAGPGAGLSERPVCYCGKTGCVELYTSGVAVEADYERRAGVHMPLAEIAGRSAEDTHARAALDEMLEAFGRAIANVIDVVDPTAIVLGGGVSNLDVLYEEGARRVAAYVFNDELVTPILRHELGDSAGVLGAALLEG